MGQTTTVVSVLKERLSDASASLDKLVAKAKRLGVEGLTYRVAGIREETCKVVDWSGRERTYIKSWADLEVSTAPLILGNYAFIAKLEVTPSGVLIDSIPGEQPDAKWLHWGGDCEHCHTKRARKHLFVVRHCESGAQIAVGRSCLRAFLGTDNLAQVAAYFGFWGAFDGGGEGQDSWDSFRSYRYARCLQSILAMTAVAVRLFGWSSVGNAMNRNVASTASYVSLGLEQCPPLGPRGDDSAQKLWKRLRDEYSEADEHVAQQVLDWVRTDMPIDSPYTNNLAVLFAEDQIFDPKRLPLVVSSYAAWHRATEKKLRRTVEDNLPKSDWMGQDGERLREVSAVYDGSFVIGANAYSDTVLASFHTEQGNVLKWFTSRGLGARVERGERLLLTGTVKEHRTYKGERQTILTRCKVQPIDQNP